MGDSYERLYINKLVQSDNLTYAHCRVTIDGQGLNVLIFDAAPSRQFVDVGGITEVNWFLRLLCRVVRSRFPWESLSTLAPSSFPSVYDPSGFTFPPLALGQEGVEEQGPVDQNHGHDAGEKGFRQGPELFGRVGREPEDFHGRRKCEKGKLDECHG